MDLKQACASAEIIKDGNNTPKGSHTYMGYGAKIRRRYVDLILDTLEGTGYEEWNFSDLISPEDFQIMNEGVMDISKKSMFVDSKDRGEDPTQRQIMAPTHEVPIYASLRDHVGFQADLPLKFVHTGSAYRRPKSYPFPFSLGERRSFVEAHGIFDSSDRAVEEIPEVRDMMVRLMEDILQMPYVENSRPLSTNNPVSRRTICQDIILPEFHRTQIAGMIYFHDDIFARPFGVRYRSPEDQYKTEHIPSGLHFGFSDNLLLGTIVNSYRQEQRRFQLPEALLPYHVMVIIEDGAPGSVIAGVMEQLKQQGLRFKVIHTGGRREKTKAYKKSFLQGSPGIIGVNYDGRVSFHTGDTQDIHPEIKIHDIPELSSGALDLRSELRRGRVQETYDRIIVDGNGMDMKKINSHLFEGKIIQIHLQQDDSVVEDFEKNMKHGEVLGFQDEQIEGNCYLTGKRVTTTAFLSRRF